jgi:hypothetical protein
MQQEFERLNEEIVYAEGVSRKREEELDKWKSKYTTLQSLYM